jgi:hypothetical protein
MIVDRFFGLKKNGLSDLMKSQNPADIMFSRRGASRMA